VSRKSIGARLERLEEYAQQRQDLPAHWPADEWPVEDQVEDVLDYLNFHRTFGTVALCTDREINLLGIVAAHEQLGGAGDWPAPKAGRCSRFCARLSTAASIGYYLPS
jgi:hypothetical protein